MKKIFSLCATLIAALAMNATETTINPGGDALRLALANAAAGDVIILADGTYEESAANYLEFNKDITVKAAEGASPIVKPAACLRFSNAAKIKIEGIKFDGSALGSYEHFAYVPDNMATEVELEGCEFYGNRDDVTVIHIQAANHIESMTINNCYFHDNGRSCIFFDAASDPTTLTCNTTTITNSTFANIGFNASYYASVIDIRNGSNNTAFGEVSVDHCTFYDCKTLNTDHANIRVHKSTSVSVTNCIFAWGEAYDKRATYLYGGDVKNCLVYNTTKDTGTWGHHSGPTFTDCSMADPQFADAANGDYTLAETSPAINAGTDGKTLGDSRWYPKTGTGISNTAVSAKAVKFIENGQLIIMKNGVKYDITGAIVK